MIVVFEDAHFFPNFMLQRGLAGWLESSVSHMKWKKAKINLLKTKHRLLYLKAQFVPRGLEVSADKTKYVVMPRDQNAGRIQSVRIDNSTFWRVEEFK